ncbi:hypothetical protein [Brevibacillus parabrevis]|nr:hypothetical protein [Brevibacillus parabrevis]
MFAVRVPLSKRALWKTETWAEKEAMPSILEMFRAHLQINGVTLKQNN